MSGRRRPPASPATTIVLPVGPEEAFGVGAVVARLDGFHGSMPMGPAFLGPDGRQSAGALGVLVDDVTGYAVIDGLIGGSWSVSTEIWLDVLGPVPTKGIISAHSRLVHATAASGFTEGVVYDDSGIPVALCRQRGRAIPEDPKALRPSTYRVPSYPTDVSDLIGLEFLGGDAAALTVTPHLENPRHMLHGGITICAAEVTAVRSRLAAGIDLPTSSIHTAYTRGIPAGSEVEFRSTTRHGGRTFWVSEVIGWVSGRIASVTTVSAQTL